MLAFFRSMAKSKFLAVLLGLPLLVGLLAIGNVRTNLVSGLFSPSDAVVQAGSRTVSQADFKTEFETYRRQQQQQGQTLTPQDAVAAGLDQQMLRAMAANEAMAETLKRLGVWPSDKIVAAQIAQNKQFQNPVTGKFDETAYVNLLTANNLTPAQYEKGLAADLATGYFSSSAAAGLKPPRLYGAVYADYLFEAHNLALVAIDPRTLGANEHPTDADLMKQMNDNARAYTVPETRTLTVVKFSAADLAKSVTADPAEVKKRYDFRKDTLSTPETRSVVQISAKDAAAAAALSSKLKSGADPAAVAQAAGAPAPVIYNDTTKGAITDAKVADAAFVLPPGAVSGPIQGALGWAVIKVTKVTPAKIVTFDDARPQIEQEVRAEAAAKAAYAEVTAYQAAHAKGSSLVEAARAAGVTPQTLAPTTAAGIGADSKPVAGLTGRMLKEAFALPQGGETPDPVQDKKGEYFALRVDKVIPPALPSLDAARARLTQDFVQQDFAKRLDAKLKDMSARVKKGESLDSVAQSVGSQVTHTSTTRVAAEQRLQPGQVAQIFSAKVGDVFTMGTALAKVESIAPPPAGIVASAMAGGQLTMARSLFEEVQQASRDWASAKIKPKLNIALARQAIGAADAASAPTPAGGAAPAQ
jgi:peptidyl-prolyl cis-trans isomerase D